MTLSFINNNRIFSIDSDRHFNDAALEIFHFQYEHNIIYKSFLDHLGINIPSIKNYKEIPCLPVEFFKNHRVITGNQHSAWVFTSSGTTGMQSSKHHIIDIELYKKSFLSGFNLFYGDPKDYILLALLPSYLERTGSSLIYMVEELMRLSDNEMNSFYLHDYLELHRTLSKVSGINKKILLIGVSYALLDFCEKYPQRNSAVIVMETGGMKGRRKEITRDELHDSLKKGFGVNEIHSEYGMTELMSQAYSKENGIFHCPPWMKIIIRDSEDPLSTLPHGKTGGINIIDLANLYSCSFISTQDLGKSNPDGSFEISGRFDNSDVRGCNLMVY